MDITVKQLQIFQSVVVAGSITKASRRIGLSQPSISQQLAKLEERLSTQLINRTRTGVISLTPAGDYWFKACDEILKRLDSIASEHESRFLKNNVVLKIGTTPTLRGRFTSAAARITMEEPGFTKFELIYAQSSNELVEQLRLHQVNCAIVDVESLQEDVGSFRVAHLFEDKIAWVVPAEIGDQKIRDALAGRPVHDPMRILERYVELGPEVPLKAKIEGWYRHNLPKATPVFATPTYAAAVDLVAEGVGTTFCPLALLPNVTPSVRAKLRIFEIDDISRQMVLAMPRHLLTLTAYSNIFNRLADFCRTEYSAEMQFEGMEPLPMNEAA